ncbi:MAG: hypothetical protein ACOC97_04715 [Myxococcota bacterium]
MFRSAALVGSAIAMLAAPAPALAQYGEGGAGLDAPDPPQSVPPPPAGPDAQETPRGYPTAPRTARSDGPAEVSADTPDLRIPSRVATRLRVLESDLNTIASRGGNGIVDGILSVLAGGLSITFGVLSNDGGSDGKRFARYMFLWGSAQIGRGIIDFATPLKAGEAAIAFQHMPMGDRREVRERLHYGEDSLQRIARRARIGRLLDASINVGVGLAAIPLYLAAQDFEIERETDWFVLLISGVSVITGVVNLILKSGAEKRWNAYQDLRDRLGAGKKQDADRAGGVEWQVGAAPLRRGAAATLQARF